MGEGEGKRGGQGKGKGNLTTIFNYFERAKLAVLVILICMLPLGYNDIQLELLEYTYIQTYIHAL